MRIWDSELLTKKSDLQPVMDGLVFWLDGQDELYGDEAIAGESPTLYKKAHMFDRISNTRFDFTGNLGLKSDTPLLTGVYPTGSSSGTSTGTTTASVSGILTVEFVANNPNSFFSFKMAPSSGRLTFPSELGGSVWASASGGTPCIQTVGKKDSITGYPKMYQNGSDITSYWLWSPVVMSDLSGTVRCQFRWRAILGCIRLYNRILSDDEILQNLEYEKAIGRVVL